MEEFGIKLWLDGLRRICTESEGDELLILTLLHVIFCHVKLNNSITIVKTNDLKKYEWTVKVFTKSSITKILVVYYTEKEGTSIIDLL